MDITKLTIRTFGPGEPPDDIVQLRRMVYGFETGLLRDAELLGPNDFAGTHFGIYYDEGSGPRLIATTHAIDAEASDFAFHSMLPRATLEQGFYSSRSIVAKEYRNQGLFSLLLYLALRQARMRGRKYMYGFMEAGDPPGRKIMRYSFIDGIPPRVVRGRGDSTYEVHAAWQDIAYGLHRAFTTMPEPLQRFVYEQGLLADEIEHTVMARIQRFYKNPWFERLYEGSLTREQYVAVLANMHQFVRWTTRLLGRVVGMTADARLRRHYLDHLAGEVDHEVLLERDLAALDADVGYVTGNMVPIVEIQEFMAVQESAAAFQQDPVVFLAVPFAIEGLSGHLSRDFAPALVRCMEAWGVTNPRKATSFLVSHVHTDGAEDGHWEMSRKMIRELVKTEHQLQRFLNVVHLVMNSQERAYAAYAAIPPFTRSAAETDRLKLDDSASAA